MCTAKATDVMKMLAYLFMQQGMPERAIPLYAALNAHEPGRLNHLRAMAVAYSRTGRHEQTLEALDQLAMAGGVDMRFHLLRAQTLGQLGRADEASASMRAYVDALQTESEVGQ
jgi:hypothetical protein